MRIWLHIGMEHCGADRLQQVLADKRDQLAGKGILFAQSPGRKNHTRLYFSALDPDHIDPLRAARGLETDAAQQALRDEMINDLQAEITRTAPQALILSATQLGSSLHRRAELERLRDLLVPFSDDIRIVAHIDEQARVMLRHYTDQLMQGRLAPLSAELALAQAADWRGAALARWGASRPAMNDFPEIQAPPFWLDYAGLVAQWETVFGAGSVALRPYDGYLFAGADVTDELRAAFDLPNIGKATPVPLPAPPAAAALTRARLMNVAMTPLLAQGRIIPRKLWRRMLDDTALPGAPIDPGSLSALSARFADGNAGLLRADPALAPALTCAPATAPWAEADPRMGFRATQYLAAFLHRIEQATRAAAAPEPVPPRPATTPNADLPPAALQNLRKLASGPFAPHNRLGAVNEEDLAAPFAPAAPRALPKGSSGNVIVGCMKNEAPYILEWVAYHRAIGVDHFLIYTNGCEDGTSELLDRLQALGIVQHRNNDDWKGNSPQQHALNKSLKEDVVKNADWIIHIDVDEFINIRCGNGTLQDFFDRVPDATNVAMTWRLFGHNGVTDYRDDLVIDQFDTCAPKYCPKPHTVWGFKTMFRNIGAYEKLSCHRPNKLRDAFRDKVSWVNGSGQPMGDGVLDNGWRSSKGSIGYDLLQLNHYALRSAESFLIKRQRGRALHVDRSIGLNYWVRMDWSDYRDVTIKRNIPRLRAELDALMADTELARLHRAGVDWHRAKAAELHAMPEFQDLYEQALATKLNDMERVALALAQEVDN